MVSPATAPPSLPKTPLPIDPVLPRITGALRDAGAVVVRAPTGAGKTTRVPPAVAALLDEIGGAHRQVVMLEPRRIAARAAARRMVEENAEQNGWRLGREVGYQVRFDRRAGADTRVLVVTEGILVQRLQADPFLDGVGAVLFDELHERSLQADLALAMARRVRGEVRPDLRLAAMSATLDPAPLRPFSATVPSAARRSTARGSCTRWRSSGWTPRTAGCAPSTPPARRPPGRIPALAASGCAGCCRRGRRRACSLAGVAIHRVADELPAPEHGLLVAPLYGDLPPAEQDAVLSPAARRRVVLATNVAESSVTLEGIEGVVDFGWARVLRFDPASGLDRLELARISRASAAQRAGRAGRLGPGRCLRLWSEHEHRGLAERETPEIARVDLAGAALQLLAWGESDLAAFPWFEAPEPAALGAATELLRRLGAVGAQGVTGLGRAMAALPAHPRLARLLAAGRELGQPRAAALAAALLAERFPLRRRRGDGPARHSRSDLLDAAEAVERFAAGGAWTEGLDPGAARFVLRARDQLAAMAARLPALRDAASGGSSGQIGGGGGGSSGRVGGGGGGSSGRVGGGRGGSSGRVGGGRGGSSGRVGGGRGGSSGRVGGDGGGSSGSGGVGAEEAVLRAVLAAFPDRLCRRREAGSRRAVMVGGRGVELADTSAVRDAELFVAVELTERTGRGTGGDGSAAGGAGGGEARVWIASAVERAWLPAARRTTATEVELDPRRRRVVAVRRSRYEDLVLAEDEVPVRGELAAEASRVLAAAAATDLAAPAAGRGAGRLLPRPLALAGRGAPRARAAALRRRRAGGLAAGPGAGAPLLRRAAPRTARRRVARHARPPLPRRPRA